MWIYFPPLDITLQFSSSFFFHLFRSCMPAYMCAACASYLQWSTHFIWFAQAQQICPQFNNKFDLDKSSVYLIFCLLYSVIIVAPPLCCCCLIAFDAVVIFDVLISSHTVRTKKRAQMVLRRETGLLWNCCCKNCCLYVISQCHQRCVYFH